MFHEYNRIRARIDLDAIEYNLESMHRNIKDNVGMIAVIKADGYGHGAIQIANLLQKKEYLWGFAVATGDEALVLRRSGIKKPVLVLGCVFLDQMEEMIEYEIRTTVYTKERAKIISEMAGELGKQAYIHIKIDTGMSRLGFLAQEDSVKEITELARYPNLCLEGMYTHFAKADEIDKDFTKKQAEKYLWMKDSLKEKGVAFSYYHCSNSAGIIDLPEMNMDLVRAGISLYGLYPSEEVEKDVVPLKPAMELISHITLVKWIEEGTPVSYGGTFVTERRTKIATIPVGYADGYPRSLSNKGYVLIHGQKAPILGRVCMDQFMVDVTEIEEADFGDQVTLVGWNQDQHLPVEVLSDLSDRFNYEFVCDISKRVPREFLRHGEIVEQMDFFLSDISKIRNRARS